MLDLSFRPLTRPEMAVVIGGDDWPEPMPILRWGAALIQFLLDNPAPPSNYYYCKTGLP